MKVLVTYFSLTGNTAQIARAIYQEVLSQGQGSQGQEADLKPLDKVTADDLKAVDLVFLGSACHDSDLAKPAKRLLDEIGDASAFKLAGFVTHATEMPDAGERWRALYERWAGACLPTLQRACERKQIPFLGFFHCQGAPSPPIEAFIHNTIVTDQDEWATYIANVRGHPDREDLQRARLYALQVLERFSAG